jgi:hypothetical protein
MKRIVAVAVLFLMALGSAWAFEDSNRKLHGFSAKGKQKNRVIVRFRSEQAISRLEQVFPAPIRHRSKFVIKVLVPEIDELWDILDYPTLTHAGVVSTLSPTLNALMVKRDAVNKLKVSPEILEARRDSTNKITFRIDGPDFRIWADNTTFSWWSGNEGQTTALGPRLVIEYGAIRAEEPPVPPSQ